MPGFGVEGRGHVDEGEGGGGEGLEEGEVVGEVDLVRGHGYWIIGIGDCPAWLFGGLPDQTGLFYIWPFRIITGVAGGKRDRLLSLFGIRQT